jgi:hypothetical protein
MKTRLLSLLFVLQFLGQCFAKTNALPDVPEPALTAEQVLAIGKDTLGENSSDVILVGMDWCLSSQFRPRYSTGTDFPDLHKGPAEYCWFLTYIDRRPNPHLPPARQKFGEVTVIQIGSDGKGRILPWIRT